MKTNTLPELLTRKEIAAVCRCSPRTVTRMRMSGGMPAPLRVGNSLRWDAAEIGRWLAERNQQVTP